ncbi:hypothetical protein GQ457_06G010260 [Hibiscus cannabinus]
MTYIGMNSLLMGDDDEVRITHVGFGSLSTGDKSLRLCNLLCVPDIKKNLFYVSQFARDNNVFFEFHPHKYCVKDVQTKDILLEGRLTREGLYKLHSSVASGDRMNSGDSNPYAETFHVSKSTLPLELWHKRLEKPESKVLPNGVSCDQNGGGFPLVVVSPIPQEIGAGHCDIVLLFVLVHRLDATTHQPRSNEELMSQDLGLAQGVSGGQSSHHSLPSQDLGLAPEMRQSVGSNFLVNLPPTTSGDVVNDTSILGANTQGPGSTSFSNGGELIRESSLASLCNLEESQLRLTAQSDLGVSVSLADFESAPIVSNSHERRVTPLLHLTEPQTIKEALKSPHWKQATQEEYDALVRNNTLSVVELPPNRRAVSCKWIFKVKKNANGSVARYKVRLVAKGYLQQVGYDFHETFSHVVKPVTVRTILTLAITKIWALRQIDVNNAFLNGDLHEEVYMVQPPRYEHGDKHRFMCKWNKAIYGIKQAPRAWFEKLREYLISAGFCLSKSDSLLFVKRSGSSIMYLLVYVDDIILTGSDDSEVQ